MKTSDFSRYAVTICTASLLFTGCGQSQGQLGAPPTTLQSAAAQRGAVAGRLSRGDSRAAPDATTTNFTVNGRFIYLGMDGAPGKKFFVKGVDYGPTPIGTYPWEAPAMDSPLRNGNSAIWQRDLPLLRAMKANAIRVYNVVPPGFDEGTGPISDFLDAAWGNGKKPIYVLLSIYFDGKVLNNDDSAKSLANQYYEMDKKYALYPAVMGVTISNEIFHPPWWNEDHWWNNFNMVAERAKAGFAAGKNPNKIVTTSNHDSVENNVLLVIHYGELHHAQIDVWGDNPYRGRTFGQGASDLFEQIRKETTKPVLLTEYGAPESYHPDWKNTYSYPGSLKGPGTCNPTTPDGPVNRNALQLPKSGNPGMDGMVDLVTNNAKLVSDGYTKDGIVSGGFYFEWTDEWWKADSNNREYASKHVGDAVFTGHFPGCAYDHAWFGLNAIAPGGKKYLDTLTARPTIKALTAAWETQK
ncbi:MAG: hypothetical protein ACLQHL_09795 [Candidatus Cybelea sp.]